MLPPRPHARLPAVEEAVRKNLNPREAYGMVPSRDHQNGQAPLRSVTLDKCHAVKHDMSRRCVSWHRG
jgi:hypothetical protein